MQSDIKLSICIATFNRGAFISETLESIIQQLSSEIEVIVVDGNSPDNTSEIMDEYQSRYSQINYYKESVNSGVDADFDKAVGYANGKYCWLMTDDDILCPNAINSVLSEIENNRDLIIVNAVVKNIHLNKVLEKQRLDIESDIEYKLEQQETFFANNASYMSYIGCVVIKKKVWLEADRKTYYGTLFIHIGVIFQSSLSNVIVIAEPLIVIRYGNAMWTQRGFEIWMFKWPNLIWSFNHFSEKSRQRVCDKAPWMNMKTIFFYRAMDGFNLNSLDKYPFGDYGIVRMIFIYFIAIIPSGFVNLLLVIYMILNLNEISWRHKYDLLHSSSTMKITRLIARFVGIKEVEK